MSYFADQQTSQTGNVKWILDEESSGSERRSKRLANKRRKNMYHNESKGDMPIVDILMETKPGEESTTPAQLNSSPNKDNHSVNVKQPRDTTTDKGDEISKFSK